MFFKHVVERGTSGNRAPKLGLHTASCQTSQGDFVSKPALSRNKLERPLLGDQCFGDIVCK